MADCPDLNVLAAFAEGGLRGRERMNTLTHINACETCGKLYVELLRYQGEQVAKVVALPKNKVSRGLWGALAVAACVLLAFWLTGEKTLENPMPWQQPQWWFDQFGTSQTHDLNSRANQVFQRIQTGVEGLSEPGLFLIGAAGEPTVLTLERGVLLSEEALAMCYAQIDPQLGDARLALVLGHELAHLREGEHFHAFAAYQNKSGAANLGDATQEEETRADQWGLIFAAQAGFDPHVILQDSHRFLSLWHSRPLQAALLSHPEPEERARVLRNELAAVANQLDDFHYGLRFYQMGLYREAVFLMTRFSSRYGGREVLNNLGLFELGLASQQLASCDASLLTRFKLPFVMDLRSLAMGVRRRGNEVGSICYRQLEFQARIGNATGHFETALALDPGYQPARLNLMGAHLFSADGAAALALSGERPETEAARVAGALAIYLFGLGKGTEAQDRAEALSILEAMPDNPAAVYNRAAILAEDGGLAAPAMAAYLALEPYGPHADRAREMVGAQVPPVAQQPEPEQLPVPVGPISEETRGRLQGMNQRTLSLEGDRILTIYQRGELLVLAEGNHVHISEQSLKPLPLDEVSPAWNVGQIMATSSGSVVVGRNWILETHEAQATKKVRFALP